MTEGTMALPVWLVQFSYENEFGGRTNDSVYQPALNPDDAIGNVRFWNTCRRRVRIHSCRASS